MNKRRMTTAANGERFTPSEKAHAIDELREWFALDTWTMREGLLLLAGIDPSRSPCLSLDESGFKTGQPPVWARITARPGVAVDAAGHPAPNGYVLDPFQFELLSRLLNMWVSNPSHTLRGRHAPGYFVQWATDHGLQPFWCQWAMDAGLMPPGASNGKPPPVEPQEIHGTHAETAPTTEQRQDQRLARLRELDGDRVCRSGNWTTTGDGALKKLVAELKGKGDKPNDEKMVRRDLTAAAERERQSRRAGPFAGLGSR